jgi:alpha-glucosidase
MLVRRPRLMRRDKPVPRATHRGARRPDLAWWQRAVVYEIAPISFQDSNGDGKGDLRGLMSRIDYLVWPGVDVVWLTPIYPSPMLDFGYDITEFCDIDPVFGTLGDFDRLVRTLHERGLRIILDFVPNHTSDQHPWFLDSRSSRTSAKRDWYVWADPDQTGGPPNNWLSRFGGSAWQWDERTGQYYYHSFLLEQPDLNWRNGDVRNAMGNVLRFWLRRGVDGFRVDASAVLAEDVLLRDDPPNPDYDADTPPPERLERIFTDDGPESMAYLEEMRAVVDEFEDRVLAGEVQGTTDRIGHFYGKDKPRFHLPLNFCLLDSPWDALSIQANIDAYFNAIPKGAWPDWVIGSHDKRRVANKVGQAQARILAMLLMTLRGTPFLFAGDELAMEQVPIPPNRVQDPFEKLVGGYGLNRDPERSPMRWDDSQAGGFTSGEPWLPMGDDVAGRDVSVLQKDECSVLLQYRRLIALRRAEPALAEGDYVPLRSRHDILTFIRESNADRLLIALSMTSEPRRLLVEETGTLLLSTCLDREDGPMRDMLRANEGVIVRLISRQRPKRL